MRSQLLFLLASVILLLTACSEAGPEKTRQAALTTPASGTPDPVLTVTAYDPGPGTKELSYDERWEIMIRDSGETTFPGVSSLICRDLTTGDESSLLELGYGKPFYSYWESARLYPFTDLLGCDGFILEEPVGAAYNLFTFYQVSGTGVTELASCVNNIYTVDFGGEYLGLLDNYHSQGYLDLIWLEEGNVRSCELNGTAQEYLGLRPEMDWVALRLNGENGEVTAEWTVDGTVKSRMLALLDLWKWEKGRKEV